LNPDSNGESHFADVNIELAALDFAPPAPPLNLSPFTPTKQFAFLEMPAGWYGDFHPTPQRQLFVLLRGEVESIASDGEVRRLGPGSILLMEDTTGKGHASRSIGGDAFGLVVQLAD
jgi:quercetin dioxygenase-like cupin family protein